MKNLLINPPQYGFNTTTDFGSEYPIALLKLSTFLKGNGEDVELFDFLPYKQFYLNQIQEHGMVDDNLYIKDEEADIDDEFICYKGQNIGGNRLSFHRKTGEICYRLGLTFERYYLGADKKIFIDYLLANKPDRIWISSGATYHYKGTIDLIRWCKEIYPDIEITLGGIYPTLCCQHALENSGADIVISGKDERFDNHDIDYDILPNKPQYIIDKLADGCPNGCKFCAVSKMGGLVAKFTDVQRSVDRVAAISEKYGVNKIKIWGSNLLLPESGKCFTKWLDGILSIGKKFEIDCPEGFAPELLTSEICKKMKKAGFLFLNIPLETGSSEHLKAMNKAYDLSSWKKAVSIAIDAGFDSSQIESTTIVGAVGQTMEDMQNILDIRNDYKIKLRLYLYTVVPGSPWYEESDYFKSLDFDLLDGIFLPAVSDKRVAKFIFDAMKGFYIKETIRGDTMDMEAIQKMAKVLLCVAEQSEEILEKLKGNDEILKRLDNIEKNLGIK